MKPSLRAMRLWAVFGSKVRTVPYFKSSVLFSADVMLGGMSDISGLFK